MTCISDWTTLLIILWWISGITSFLYWWYKSRQELPYSAFIISAIIGIWGPIVFLYGLFHKFNKL
jgi:hypothetical protein